MDSNKNSNNIDYIEIAGGSYMQHQRPLNPITSLSTPPIITTAYNNGANGNGGGGGTITPPPDSSRSSGAQPLRIAPAQYPNIIPANYVNISNNLTGFPLQNIAAQCCLPNQQQYFTNDASNQNKIISVSKPNIQVNAPRDANSSTRPPSLHQQERPESIVFLYQIPNDSKIYLVKCVEVSQLLDTDYHSLEGILHNRSQPQQQVQQNLKNNLQQHLQNRLQPQQSQPSQNLALYQQQQITLQQNQIRHHPYQQRQSPKETVHNTLAGKNVKVPASNNFQTNVNNQDISQFNVDMNNAGNFDMAMIPMAATPGAPYMVTPSATPTMRNDHIGNNMELCVTSFLQQQQQQTMNGMLTAAATMSTQQQVFDAQFKK
ncbi:hypothetical protein F8M41_004806 [Gigaspora margarita]|uniref:Uncharacterized protein n=1 Tax=Gigaspora margarita TaxID=4874 RepID=A0A8H3X9W1_GIGMA|nr:hypothetical protein F8M41_004806 [Gigaspora margarita]